MKHSNIFICIFCSIILYSCSPKRSNGEASTTNEATATKAPLKQNDWNRDNLKGKVKSLKEQYYVPNKSEKPVQPDGGTAKHYSEAGLETAEESFSTPDKVTKYTCHYNNAGNKVERTIYFNGERDSSKTIFKYDSLGHEIEDDIITDTLVGRILWKYNSNGIREVKLIYYGITGNLKLISTSNYSADGKNIVEEETESGKSIFKCDDKGNEIEMLKYDLKGNLIFTRNSEYTFDKAGNWVKRTITAKEANKEAEPWEVIEREIEYY